MNADEKYEKAYTEKDGTKVFATASDQANWLTAKLVEGVEKNGKLK